MSDVLASREALKPLSATDLFISELSESTGQIYRSIYALFYCFWRWSVKIVYFFIQFLSV